MIRAFLEEFSNKDDVSFILSSRFVGSTDKIHNQRIKNDFQYVRGLVNKPDHELPHIVLHSAYTPENKMPRLYNSAHAFVLMSRGEGFGLPLCEAGSSGLPCIVSDHGGQKDIVDEETAYLVPPSEYFMSKRSDPAHKNMAWISHFYEDQYFPDYTGESFELLKHHMRHVYENYGEAQRKGALLRESIKKNFDWSVSIDKVYKRLSEICEDI